MTLYRRWQPDFPQLAPELVLAVMAQESHCIPTKVSGDAAGSVGLMQVSPTSGRPGSERLLDPALNVYWGMRILAGSMDLADGAVYTGLAYYNCGVDGVNAGKCGGYGGYAYADRVLGVWLPLMAVRLGKTVTSPTPTITLTPVPTWTSTPAAIAVPPTPTAPRPTEIPKADPPKEGPLDILLIALALGAVSYGALEIIRFLSSRRG